MALFPREHYGEIVELDDLDLVLKGPITVGRPMGIATAESWHEVDPPQGWCGCHDYWPAGTSSAVQVPAKGVDGDQDREVRQVLRPGGGHTKYWGVVAWASEGARRPRRIPRPSLGFVGFILALCLVAAGATVVGLAVQDIKNSRLPAPVVEKHAPSDLDKGGNPKSYEVGHTGPQGPKGPRGEQK